jgi:hypothetical protein
MSDVNKTHNEAPAGKVKTKVTMGMKVIRVDGSTEDHGEQYSKVVELDYADAVELLGAEKANELFGESRGSDDGND